jgi:hypothetical protein
MKKFLLLALLPVFFSLAQMTEGTKDTTTVTQPQETTAVTPTKEIEQPKANPWYYGGTIGFNFWGDYFYLSVNPFVGYKVSPKFSVGGKVQYVYINDDDFTSHNYGASIFSRFRPIPPIYLHAEFAYASYERQVVVGIPPRIEEERTWVPFILLGGGFVQQISANTAAYVEVLVDVLQDENSPYEEWDPIVSVGVGVGF